jgi:hypothetical protein
VDTGIFTNLASWRGCAQCYANAVSSAGQDIPGDSVSLWRYLDLGRFLWMLETQSLYFARLAEFNDRFEATLPAGLRERLNRTPSSFLDKMYQLYADRSVITCWHENEYESEAMWSLYTSGPEGVAIKTNVGRVRAAMRGGPSNLLIARVRYIDHARDDPEEGPAFAPETPLFCKRRGLEHEREVRFAIVPAFFGQEVGAELGLSSLPNGEESRTVEFTVKKDWNPDFGPTVPALPENGGFVVPVNLTFLIDRIVVSPRYPSWAIKSLQSLLDRSGAPVEVETSDFVRSPGQEARRHFVINPRSIELSATKYEVESSLVTASIVVGSSQETTPFTFSVGSSVDWIIGAGSGYLPATGPTTLTFAINGSFAFQSGALYSAVITLSSAGFVSKRIPLLFSIKADPE